MRGAGLGEVGELVHEACRLGFGLQAVKARALAVTGELGRAPPAPRVSRCGDEDRAGLGTVAGLGEAGRRRPVRRRSSGEHGPGAWCVRTIVVQ